MKLVKATFAWTLFFSNLSLGASLAPYQPLNAYEKRNQSPYSPTRPTIKKLKRFLQANEFTSLDRAIEAMKAQNLFPGLFDLPVLVYSSQSLLKDYVSRRFPRAIFQQDGFLAAVITDPDAGWAYETLEVAELNPKTHQWMPKRFHFQKPPKNLTACADCHGTPYSPKWGSYGMWVGVLGSLFDRMSKDEADLLARWKSSRETRLSWIANKVRGRPNFELALNLSALQGRSAMATFIETGIYDRYKFSMYGAFLDCGNFEKFFPNAVRESHELLTGFTIPMGIEAQKLEAMDYFSVNKSILQTFYPSNTLLLSNKSNFELPYASAVAKLRFIVDGQSLEKGLRLSRWGFSADPGVLKYHFSDGKNGIRTWLDREFESVFRKDNPTVPAHCDDLEKASFDSLN